MKLFKRAFILSILLIILSQTGCGWLRIATRSVGRGLVESPELAWKKVQQPVKDSVRLSALWAGQSTVLIQIYDKVILFDPLLSNYIMGVLPLRKEIALEYDSLKKLDLIAISHSHMDHLNFSALQELSESHPGIPLIFPMGTEDFMPDFNLDMIRADTKGAYENKYTAATISVNGINVTPVFADHNGGRYGFDTYLWNVPGYCGYIIQYKDVTVYFAGDTGYDKKAFKEIGKQFTIDLALIPTGPCRNCDGKGSWFHTSSLEALEVFLDLKAKYMIPIHYGTLMYMGNPTKPVDVVNEIISSPEKYLSEYNYPGLKDYLNSRVKILQFGEQFIFDELSEPSKTQLPF